MAEQRGGDSSDDGDFEMEDDQRGGDDNDEGDFEMEEEEYQEKEEHNTHAEPSKSNWWAMVNKICNEGAGDEESDGIRSESDLDSLCSDEEEQSTRKSKREFNPHSSHEDIQLKLGMIFPSIKHLREVLKEVFIRDNRDFKYLANDKTRVRAKCKGLGCKWLIYARVQNSDQKTVRINTLVDTHDCGIVFDNKLVNCSWLAQHFIEQFRLNPHLEYQSFREMVAATNYSNVTRPVFYLARKRAREILEGSVKDQYRILEDYCKQLIATDPGTTALLKTTLVDGQRIFERVYICYKACKDGFNQGCRPLLGFDGCFLKGYCRGMLLAAVGIDANNSQYPIAFVVVEKENTETWTWFLTILREDLDVENPARFTMMSDRQKGLGKALANIIPGAESRFCVRHLHANFKKDYPGLYLKQLLWGCARATTRPDFTKIMNELKEENERRINGC